MTTRTFDRAGHPIPWEAWASLFEDREYCRVAENRLPNGPWVSTVWLGLDHRHTGEGPPLIFETMVFPEEGAGEELDMRRYSTEEEALVGHHEMVKQWGKPMTLFPILTIPKLLALLVRDIFGTRPLP